MKKIAAVTVLALLASAIATSSIVLSNVVSTGKYQPNIAGGDGPPCNPLTEICPKGALQN